MVVAFFVAENRQKGGDGIEKGRRGPCETLEKDRISTGSEADGNDLCGGNGSHVHVSDCICVRYFQRGKECDAAGLFGCGGAGYGGRGGMRGGVSVPDELFQIGKDGG